LALSNHDILLHRNRRVVIEPFDEEGSCTPSGYDLRVGFAIVMESEDDPLSTNHELDYMAYQREKDGVRKQDSSLVYPTVEVHPGKSVAILTKERIYLTGRVLGTVFSKASITGRGLGMNSFTVDPTFQGRLLIRMKNESLLPITITLDERIATLVLETVDTETQALAVTPTGTEVTRHYSVVFNSLAVYENYYEKEHTKGKVAFEKAVDEAKNFRRKPWLLRKVIQYTDLWKLRGRLHQTGLRSFEALTLAIAPVVDIVYIFCALYPTWLNGFGTSFLTPAPVLSLAAFNLAWLTTVRTIVK
jgi:deoxycytidine triphosphate deaminase